MHKHVILINERVGTVDLSPLKDVLGNRLVLQSKGHKDAEREVEAAVLQVETVKRMLTATPAWLSWRDVTVHVPAPNKPEVVKDAPPVAPKPAETESAGAPPDADPSKVPGDGLETVERTAPPEEEDAPAQAAAEDNVSATDESTLSMEVKTEGSSNPGDNRGNRKNRR
jgi:hypothetical protein